MPNQRYPHLELSRLDPATPRRKKGGGGSMPLYKHDNVKQHGEGIERELGLVEAAIIERKPPQFDPGLIIKLRIQAGTVSEDALRSFGIEIVSEESDETLIIFVNEDAKQEFLRRMARYKVGLTGHGVSANVFHAIEGIATWSREDRLGRSLKGEEWGSDDIKVVDIELWPREQRETNRQECAQTAEWLTGKGGEVWDKLVLDSVVMLRARLTGALLDEVLDLETVRCVEIPPTWQFEAANYDIELSNLVISGPGDGAGTLIAVLDSGVISGHPLIEQAVGEETSFVDGVDPHDETGHGTAVAGFALYGDIAYCLGQRQFATRLRILSGKVLSGQNAEYDKRLIAGQVTDAVNYFCDELGCRIFNISFGDLHQPYDGRHVKGLAAVLDELARTKDILFVVSAGNFRGTDEVPSDWREEYPAYLFSPAARIIDPAPALNVLTVGSLARYDQDCRAANWPHDPAYQPIARPDELSPFTRTGPGPNGAIKPDLVEYGGNVTVDLRAGGMPRFRTPDLNISEICLKHSYVGERLFTPLNGTSFAAPKITNLAGRLLREYPESSSNLLRALILLNATWPENAKSLLEHLEDTDPQIGFYSYGYGRPDTEKTIYSLESCVTLVAEEQIGHDQTHFFEIPLPEDFLVAGKVERFIRVALAYCPPCRSTRKTYKGSKISFKIVEENDLGTLSQCFSAGSNLDNIDEWPGFRPGSKLRSKGTAMASSKMIKIVPRTSPLRNGKHLFVVVTHQVEGWAKNMMNDQEPYALVVALESFGRENIRLYTQLRTRLRQRARARG
ncbi:MAG: S8 family peptidase [Deltaproteobacteria bacterium]|nr:S8 family peptidase [Deltaproteobacteria bacterium]